MSPTRSAARPRPALSREVILDAAAALTLEQPTVPLTLARLGTELSADPTAFYRHFRSREELLLALGDRIMGEVLDSFVPGADVFDSIRQLAHALRTELMRRPAVAIEVGPRFTGGPSERASIEALSTMFEQLGLSPTEARQHVRIFGALVLAHICYSASVATQPPAARELDAKVAHELYGSPSDQDPDDYEAETFERIIDLYETGLRAALGPKRIDHHNTKQRGDQ